MMALKIIFNNIRGYRANLSELQNLLVEEKPDILFLSETMLDGKVDLNYYRNKLKGYKVAARKDRPPKPGRKTRALHGALTEKVYT